MRKVTSLASLPLNLFFLDKENLVKILDTEGTETWKEVSDKNARKQKVKESVEAVIDALDEDDSSNIAKPKAGDAL